MLIGNGEILNDSNGDVIQTNIHKQFEPQLQSTPMSNRYTDVTLGDYEEIDSGEFFKFKMLSVSKLLY